MPRDPFELLNEHIPVSRETFDRLKTYYDLLLKWQAKINLVGDDTIPDAWQRHFLDSLQLLPHIGNANASLVDLGSGAGFPGMPLAIAGAPHVFVVESDAKKVAFLKEVARQTGAHVTVCHARAENLSLTNVGVITARALADINKLLSLSSPVVSHETFCLFPKGKNYAKEIEDAKKEWAFDFETIPSVTDPQSVILKLSHIKRRNA